MLHMNGCMPLPGSGEEINRGCPTEAQQLIRGNQETLYDKLKITKSQLRPGGRIHELRQGRREGHW